MLRHTGTVPVTRLDVASEVLGGVTSITALLPDAAATLSRSGVAPSSSVLYLLHGLGEDDGAWLRRSRLAERVAGLDLAVVLPRIGSSFGVDEAEGKPYGTYLAEELPDLVERHLGLTPGRERTAVAGASMGGYAALRWALRDPGRFAAAASLSGSLDIADPDRYRRRPALMQRLFGGRAVPGTADDLLWLVERVGRPMGPAAEDSGGAGTSAGTGAAGQGSEPALYVACGEQDSHLAEARRFADAARAAGVPVTVDVGPGGHDWGYWDAAMGRVLAWLGALGVASDPR